MMKELLETSFFALLAGDSRENFEDEKYGVAIREFACELREVSEDVYKRQCMT